MEVTRFKLKDKASSYNRSLGDKLITRLHLWRHRRLRIGFNSVIRRGVRIKMTDNARFTIGSHCSLNEDSLFLLTKPNPVLEIGDYSGIGVGCLITVKDHLTIGNYVRIAPHVYITDNSHQFRADDLIMNQPATIQPVTIGDDVWIGRGVTILKGVTISKGAVIGAGSVVRKDVPPYGIWAGNPAKMIGTRK